MKRYLITFLSLFFLGDLQFVYCDELTDESKKILSEINTMNQFSDIYTGMIDIAYFEPDKKPLLTSYQVYAKGLDNVLLITKAPANDAGKKILMKKDTIWFYFPKLKKSIVMNPTSVLFGSVAIGDVASPPILDIYNFESIQKIKVDDKDIWELTFTAKNRNAPYGKTIYHYYEDQIIYTESYSRSAIKLKQAYFSDFVINSKGVKYATKIKIVDSTNPKYYSLIKISNLEGMKTIPDYYFTPEGLEMVK